MSQSESIDFVFLQKLFNLMMHFVIHTYCLQIQSGLPTLEQELIIPNNGKLKSQVNLITLDN